MATATTVQYRDEWIQGFTRLPTVYRPLVTTDAMVNGLSAVFLIVNTTSSAVTRGANGKIPSTSETQTQVTCTLVEEHSKKTKTGFNIFTGQANQRALMQAQGRIEIHNAIDNRIRDEIATGTVQATGISQMGSAAASTGVTILGNANVPLDGNIFCAVTPNQWAIMEDEETFASADYVEMRPYVMGAPDPQAMPVQLRRWRNVNWFVDTGLPGVGTTSATCLMWHRSAVGYCYDPENIQVSVGYDEEDDYSYARHTVYHGAKKLQNSGIVTFSVDDTTYSA